MQNVLYALPNDKFFALIFAGLAGFATGNQFYLKFVMRPNQDLRHEKVREDPPERHPHTVDDDE